MSDRWALVRADNTVDNVIIWGGGESMWPGLTPIQLEADERCEPGGTYQPGQTPRFLDAPAPPAEQQP